MEFLDIGVTCNTSIVFKRIFFHRLKKHIHYTTHDVSKAAAFFLRRMPEEESSFRNVVCVYVVYVFLGRWESQFNLLLMCCNRIAAPL